MGGLLAGLGVGFYLLKTNGYLEYASLEAEKTRFLELMRQRPWTVGIGFFVVYAIACCLPPPLAAGMTMLAGVMYGIGPGLAMCVVSASTGGVLAFYSARYLFKNMVRTWVGPHRLRVMDHRVADEGLYYVLFLRGVGLLPFFLVSLAMGLTHIRLRVFVAGTLVGMLPISSLLVTSGAQLAKIKEPSDLFSPAMVAVFGLMGGLTLLPIVLKNRKIKEISQP